MSELPPIHDDFEQLMARTDEGKIELDHALEVVAALAEVRMAANKERAEAASELIRRYYGREVLHVVNGTYDNEEDGNEPKNN